jgi:Chromo (CHRromatin Organisation MOdifier) domain
LITKKTRDVHASQLKSFRFDPTKRSPADIARRDYMEFFIEDIISHVGDKKKPTGMKFHVKWLNYDSTHNTWEPWQSLRTTDQLHKYLREHDMYYTIPKQFRMNPPSTREES